ncbi:hypothetical protein G6F22_019142 [Rhizopus arrhizus]|nr:hypothetical protein G6F22_019142 [Rhizopus arrhizus]
MELMKSMTGAKLMHIAYRGAGPAFTDVISGQVSMIWEPVPASLPYIKGGQIRPIAIAADTRSPELPDTPTFKEAGPAGRREEEAARRFGEGAEYAGSEGQDGQPGRHGRGRHVG